MTINTNQAPEFAKCHRCGDLAMLFKVGMPLTDGTHDYTLSFCSSCMVQLCADLKLFVQSHINGVRMSKQTMRLRPGQWTTVSTASPIPTKEGKKHEHNLSK